MPARDSILALACSLQGSDRPGVKLKELLKRGRPVRSESLYAVRMWDMHVFPSALGLLPRGKDFLPVVLDGDDDTDEGEKPETSEEVVHWEGKR